MESLFDKQGNQNIVDRINQLTPITLSQWGKMTVSQMLEHCQQPIKVSFGTLELKPNLISFLFGKSAKKQMLTQPPNSAIACEDNIKLLIKVLRQAVYIAAYKTCRHTQCGRQFTCFFNGFVR